MQRIIDTTAAASLPSPPALTGTTGYFTEGSPGVTAATRVRGWWVNMIQEELLALLTAAGVAFDTTAAVFTQVLASIKILTIQGRQDYSAAGTFSFTVPVGVFQVWVRLWGATGGSGGSNSTGAGSGAAAGGYSEKVCAVTPGNVLTVVIGGGGTAGGTGTDGGAGAASTVTCVAASIAMTSNPGGVGRGGAGGGGASATGGSATGGDLNLTGGSSASGVVSGTLLIGGSGGASPFGGGITSITIGTGQNGNIPGGGPGGGANAQAGVAGNPGWCRITWG